QQGRGGEADEQHPREQGLKPSRYCTKKQYGKRRRAASTRTRIETSDVGIVRLRSGCRRAASTRTRIETQPPERGRGPRGRADEQHPREQGLKLVRISGGLHPASPADEQHPR